MPKLRISAISFLNTAPLMWDFEQGVPPAELTPPFAARKGGPPAAQDGTLARPLSDDFEISYTIPSRCAEALRAGEADIGIIPVFAYAEIPDLVIVPEVAIAAKGPVRSILLLSKTPVEKVGRVAVDTSSRTSVALLRLLFRKWWGGEREFIAMEPDPERMLQNCDAALLIGDAALKVPTVAHGQVGAPDPLRSRWGTLQTYDLAAEWQRLTGKPFVFAFWAVRLQALKNVRNGLDVTRVFQQSRDHGLQPQNLQVIAREWAPRVGLSEAEVVSYLTHNVDYGLDAANREGMELFFRYAAECGILSGSPDLRFLGSLRCSLAAI